MDWQAIWLSVKLASATTVILLAVGAPLAYWLAFSRRRWKFLVESVVALPLVLPPTVLGFYVLLAIGPRSPVGALYGKLTGGITGIFTQRKLDAASVEELEELSALRSASTLFAVARSATKMWRARTWADVSRVAWFLSRYDFTSASVPRTSVRPG